MTTEQLQYLKKALAFVFSLVEPDEYIGKCPEADYEAINGLIEGEIERLRENRTTEPDGGQPGIRQKQCDWCENPRMMDGWISVEGRGASMYIDEFRYCPNCGREL
jgi:hypothetical protein